MGFILYGFTSLKEIRGHQGLPETYDESKVICLLYVIVGQQDLFFTAQVLIIGEAEPFQPVILLK